MAVRRLPIIPSVRRTGGYWAAVAVLLLAAFFLRVFHLDLQAATGDDAFSLMIAQHSLGEIVQLARHELHPPLFYFLLHAWQPFAGTSEFAGRFLAASFGVLAGAGIFRLGAALGGRILGVTVLLLAVVNPLLIDFAQQVRAYPQLIFLLVVSAYCQLRILRGASGWSWAVYVTVTALALYSHLFAAFVLLAQDVLFLALVLSRRFKAVAAWLGSQVAIVGLYLPWLALDSAALQSYGNDMVRAVSLPAMSTALIPAFLTGLGSKLVAWQFVLAGALVAIGLVAWRGRGEARLMIACWLLAPPMAVYAISLWRPIFFERYMVIILPAFLLAAAAGGLVLTRPWPALELAALAALCAPSVARLPGYYGKVVYASTQDIRSLLGYVRDSAQPDAAFIVNLPPSDPMYQYYAPAQPTFFVPNPPQGQQEAANQQLSDILSRHGEVWLTPWDYDRTAFVEHWFDQHAFRVDQHWFSNAEIIRYERPRQPGQFTASSATFLAPDAQIRLAGYQFFGTEVRAGQPIMFALQWQADATPAERYKVFAHLVDPQGKTVTQRDDEPVANTRPTTSWKPGETLTDNYGLVVPRGAAPGAYQVFVGLYKLEGLQRLKLKDGSDHVTLGPISVQS